MLECIPDNREDELSERLQSKFPAEARRPIAVVPAFRRYTANCIGSTQHGEFIVDWEAVGAIAELLAAIGVIGSLVYLAKQIKARAQHDRDYAGYLWSLVARNGRRSGIDDGRDALDG